MIRFMSPLDDASANSPAPAPAARPPARGREPGEAHAGGDPAPPPVPPLAAPLFPWGGDSLHEQSEWKWISRCLVYRTHLNPVHT